MTREHDDNHILVHASATEWEEAWEETLEEIMGIKCEYCGGTGTRHHTMVDGNVITHSAPINCGVCNGTGNRKETVRRKLGIE